MARNGTRRQEIDLSGYSMMRGTAKNGSFYATFRQSGKPTLTSFGEVAERMVRASVSGEPVRLALAGNLRTTARIDSVRCDVTGLDIREDGRVPAVPTPAGGSLPTVPSRAEAKEPEGFWSRLRDGAREWLGIRDEPAPVPEDQASMRTGKARSGYPVVDDLIDRIGLELEKRPDLMDENGSRFDSLADRYLLEMAANHAAAVKDASRVHVEQADRMFSEYVGITDQSLSESVRREQDLEVGGRMDRLSIDLAFIRARQGVDQDATLRAMTGSHEEASIAPPSSVRMLPSGREESRRILSLGKGPGALSDGAEVVVLHARRPGGPER